MEVVLMKRLLMLTGKEIYSRKVFFVLSVFILFMYLPFFAEAETYYVCDDGRDCNSGRGSGWRTGNDRNMGTSKAAPWKTIDYGAKQLEAGDILIVGDGTYTDHDGSGAVVSTYNLVGSGWGKGTKQITIEAENRHGAKIGGNRPRKYTHGIAGSGKVKFVWIEGFEIYGVQRALHFNSLKAYQQDNIYIKDCKIHDIGNYQQRCKNAIAAIKTPPAGSDITIDSCYFYNIGRLPGCRGIPHDYVHDHAIYATGKRILIKNCIFRDITSGWAIKIDHHIGKKATGRDWTHRIVNNTFHGSDNPKVSGHIAFFSNKKYRSYNVVIANNVFHQPPDNNPYGFSAAIWAGVYDSASCSTNHFDKESTTIINNATNAENLVFPCSPSIDKNNRTSVSGDMGMTNPRKHNFTLTSDAALLIDKASSKYASENDYTGNTRPRGGGYDIGAFEGKNSTTSQSKILPPSGLKVLQ
jgi:hypothetical protein